MQKKNNYSIIPELKLSKIVHLLGTILGLVIKEQEGNSFFNKIETFLYVAYIGTPIFLFMTISMILYN